MNKMWVLFVAMLSVPGVETGKCLAQAITPAGDGTGTLVTPEGNRFEIMGGQRSPDGVNLFHSFEHFNLDAGQIANFQSLPEIQNILGRITGGNASYINGLIQITGGPSNLFLMNPAGILFGSNAQLNLPGDLTVTTATGIGFGNHWFNATGDNNWANLVGTPSQFAFNLAEPAAIANLGHLNLADGQHLSLIGGTVLNAGTLESRGGQITIAAVPGESVVRISQPNHLLSLEIAATPPEGGQTPNFSSEITPMSLPELLTGGNVSHANQVEVQGDGSIALSGSKINHSVELGDAIASGTLEVSGEMGGEVTILGERIAVMDATINANGTSGGGDIRIGGEFQGGGTIPNARRTFVNSFSAISADSLVQGDGGRIIVWGDETTRFYGNITAQGGLQGGNGGFAEVSGKQYLDFAGTVNLSSPMGNLGTLLLDPINIEVVVGPNNPGELAANDHFADPGANNTINNGTIAAATADVFLQASNDITFNAPINIATPGVGLVADAGNNIRVNQNITTNGGPVSFFADGNLKIVNATIATNGGDFIGSGTGTTGVSRVGVDLFNSAILAGGGNIQLTGIGGTDPTNNYGVQLLNGSRLQTTDTGTINIAGSGGLGLDGGHTGLWMDASTIEHTGSGEIILQGTGGDSTGTGIATFSNNGIRIASNSVVSSTSGDILLTGKGGNGDYGNHRALTVTNGTRIQTGGTGTITFSAIGGNSTSDGGNFGLLISGVNTQVSAVDGNINLNGIGGDSGGVLGSNRGISIQDNAIIQTTGIGDIDITGTGGFGNTYNEGIYLFNSATIQAMGTGSITLNGTGGSGSSNNFGILASGTEPIVRTGDGNILLRGTGASTGILNVGMLSSNVMIETTGTGEITLIGEGTGGGDGLNLGNSTVTANGGGTVRLQGDEINLTGTTAIAGTGILQVEPFSTTIPITVGGEITWNTAQLNLETTDIAAIKNGFDRVFIGSPTGSNAITLQGDATFNSSVTIQAPGAGGSIAYTGGTLSGANQSAIALVADGNVAASNITTPGGTIEITSNTGNITTVAGTTLNTSTTTGDGGAITLSAPNGNIAVSNLTTATTDSASTSQAGPITLTSGTGSITLNGNINTSATAGSGSAIAFAGDVTLTQPTTTLTSSGTAGGGEITFNQTLNGTNPGTESLILNAGSGNISILGPVGNLTPLAAFTLNSTGTTLLNSPISVQTLTTDAGGTTQLNHNITTTGAIAFGDAVNLGLYAVTLTSGGNPITFGSTLDGTLPLNLDAGLGDITFVGAVGSQTELGAMTVNSTGTTLFSSSVNSASLITYAGGVTQINGNVTTTDVLGQVYGNALSIIGDIILTGDGIEFQQAVSGTGSLTLAPYTLTQAITVGGTTASGVGTLDLTAGEIGLLQPGFTKLTIGGSNTSGLISLIGNLELNIPLTLQALGSGGAINTTGGTLTGNAAAAIALQADGTIQTGNILNSSGTVTLTSNTGNIDTSVGTLDTSSPTASGGAITLNAPTGMITLGGINSSTTAADSTTTAGTVILNAVSGGITLYDDINSSATDGSGLDIMFTGDVTLAQSVLLNASGTTASGNILFNQRLNSTTGSESLTAVAGSGNVTFSGAVGDINPLADLTVSSTGMTQFGGTVNAQTLTTNAGGTTTVGGNITTTGGQSYGNPVSILGNITFTGDEIDFYNPVSGTGDLILQPFTPSLAIALGGGFDPGTTTLDLTVTDLGWLQNGFNSLTIGRANSSGPIALSGNVTVADPLTVRSPLNPGSITTTGFTLSGTDNATLTLQSSGNITTGPISTSGNAITLNSTTGAIDTTGGTLNTTAATQGGPVTLTAAQTLSTGDILTYSTTTGNGGPISLNTPSAIATGSLDASAVSGTGGTILLNGSTLTFGNITTTNNTINLNAPVTLATDATIQITGNGGAIAFASTLDGSRNLTLNAGNGPITFQGAIGSLNPLQNLTVITTGTTAIANQITVNNTLDFTAATGGTQLTTDVAITANTGNILLQNSSISGANRQLTLSAPTGTISLDAIGSNGNELGALTIESAAILNLFGNIYTNGGIDFTQANTINLPGSGIILETDSDNGSLTTTGVSVNGPGFLTVNAGTGNVEFGTLGNSTPLAGITVNAATVNAPSAITVGTGGMTINASGAIATGSPITATGIVNFTANTDITTQAITGTDITLTSNNGAIAISDGMSASGAVAVNADKDINTQAITGTDITLTSNNGAIATSSPITATGAVNFTANTDINTQAITGTGITLTSNTGAIATGSPITATGIVNFTANTDITTQAITGTDITLTSNTGAIAISDGMSASGAVAVNADKDINTQAITGTDITLTSNNGAIATSSPITATGAVNFTANTDINTQAITGTGITLTSNTGAIATGSPITATGIVNFTANTDITTQAITGTDITLTSNNGAIAIDDGVSASGAVAVNADKDINTQAITGTGITLTSNNGAIATSSPITATGAVNFTANTDINTQAITGTDITLTSNTGAIAIGDGVSASGAVAVNADKDINTQAITGTGITLTSNNGAIATGSSITATGAVNFTANTDINTQAITGTDITLTSNTGAIATQGPITSAGTVNFTAPNDVTTQDIRARNINITSTNGNLNLGNLNTASTTAAGGYIFLTSNTGAIATGHLTSSGATDGGEIFVNASTQITAGEINSSGTSGVGGNVTLDPSGDIQVTWINSEGATQGGFVDITTGRFFRATGSFTNRQGNSASISSLGGNGGPVTIRHGGNGITPFIVGDGTNNGTAAQITTGSSAIASGSFLYTFTQGNIGIISVPEPPPPVETPVPSEEVPAPVETPLTPTPAPVQTPRGIVVPVNPILPEELPPQTAQPEEGLPINVPTAPRVPQERAPIAQLSTEQPGSSPQEQAQPPVSRTQEQGQPRDFEPQSPESMTIALLEDATGISLSPLIPIVSLETRSPMDLSIESTTESTTESAIVNFPEDYRKNPLSPLENPGFYSREQILSLEPSLDPQFSLTYHELGRERMDAEYDSLNSDSTIARLENQYSPTSSAISPPEAQISGSNTPQTSTDSNSNSTAISAKIDRIFEENNPEASIWTIEQLRNQEFGQYLGVTANLAQQSIALKYFQEVLQTIERQTGKQAAIIYAIARESQLELILVPPVGNPIRYSVPEAPRETLLAEANEFRQSLTDPKQRHNTRYLRSAQQLHDWLIAPMEQDLQKLGISTLMFSLDPGLRSIPLAALHDGEKFLIETYSYSLIPSFSLTNHIYKPLENVEVLAMGASEFSHHKALPGVPLELEAIASESWPGKSFLNQQFTRENLLTQQESEAFSIIHLATHAEFLPGNASNSYIQLWDNQLYLDEIPSLNWDNPQVELVVLSACRTALGDEEAELGFGGLAVQSGVKTAVASLWYVSDEGTLGLMRDFYHHLRTSPLKAEALRQAQINMIHNTIRIENGQLLNASGTLQLPPELSHLSNFNLSHPYYWSGFTAIGSPW
ncbi:CHAT domain-containing protein [Laspinema palackyanum]|uniref:CHAT domain-containing protein n=1 Tax=Laspinema palackyanum TaxID=3231601 RepID=UPI00345CB8D6|nr:CHAT domain-containing protein [Laspinema sp. D2c]